MIFRHLSFPVENGKGKPKKMYWIMRKSVEAKDDSVQTFSVEVCFLIFLFF